MLAFAACRVRTDESTRPADESPRVASQDREHWSCESRLNLLFAKHCLHHNKNDFAWQSSKASAVPTIGAGQRGSTTIPAETRRNRRVCVAMLVILAQNRSSQLAPRPSDVCPMNWQFTSRDKYVRAQKILLPAARSRLSLH